MVPEGIMIFDRALTKIKFANRASVSILANSFYKESKFNNHTGDSTITETEGNSSFGTVDEPLSKEDFLSLYVELKDVILKKIDYDFTE